MGDGGTRDPRYGGVVIDELYIRVPADLQSDLIDERDEDIDLIDVPRSNTALDVLNIAVDAVNVGASVVTVAVAVGAVGRFARRLYDAVARRRGGATDAATITITVQGPGGVTTSVTVTAGDDPEVAGRTVRVLAEALTTSLPSPTE